MRKRKKGKLLLDSDDKEYKWHDAFLERGSSLFEDQREKHRTIRQIVLLNWNDSNTGIRSAKKVVACCTGCGGRTSNR